MEVIPSVPLNRIRRTVFVLLILLLAAPFYAGLPESHAQGGSIAASGIFSGWELEMPQGSRAGDLDRFLVVFNNTGDSMDFTTGYRGPEGIAIEFSDPLFTLEPASQKRVSVTVVTSEDAVPGSYELRAIVTASVSGAAEGVGVATGISQKARVTVIGDFAIVGISVLSPQNQPVVADVRLFRDTGQRRNEVAYSITDPLTARVSPGSYIAQVMVGGETLANEAFQVSADETKEIEFVVRTVSISDVTLTPHYRGESTELSFVAMTYSLNNMGSPAAAAEVILKVSKDNAPFDETSILSLDTLVVGTTRGSHNYIPPAGWESGVYGLKAELFITSNPYTSSLEATISAGSQAMVGPVTQSPFLPTPRAENVAPTTLVPAGSSTPESTNDPQTTPGNTASPAATPISSDLLPSSETLGVMLEKVVLVSLDRRANVEIPQGTLALSAQGRPLSMLEIRPSDSPTALPPDTQLIGVVYAFGPAGSRFSPPVSVSLVFEPTDLSSMDGGEELAILRYDVVVGWTRLETSVDAANFVATARTAHFSQFALAALQPSSSSWALTGGVIGGAAALALLMAATLIIRKRSRRTRKFY